MTTTILVLLLTFIAQTSRTQTEAPNAPTVEDHIRDVIRELPPDSALRRNLLQGARGNGVHESWMDEMRKQGIRRIIMWIDINFDSKGRPKKLSLNRTEYFAHYEDGMPISSGVLISTIRTTGIEKELGELALERARHGFWVDLPRPKPDPFLGGAHVEFLDHEWLPVPSHPSFYVSKGN
jgi:hypothetical protein